MLLCPIELFLSPNQSPILTEIMNLESSGRPFHVGRYGQRSVWWSSQCLVIEFVYELFKVTNPNWKWVDQYFRIVKNIKSSLVHDFRRRVNDFIFELEKEIEKYTIVSERKSERQFTRNVRAVYDLRSYEDGGDKVIVDKKHRSKLVRMAKQVEELAVHFR